jgi:hypothetical protein
MTMRKRDPIEDLLARYPKTRPPLPEAHTRIYASHYRFNRAANRGLPRLTGRLERWMHHRAAAGAHGRILEVGAGNLNHLPYHPDAIAYEIVEPFHELFEDSPHLGRVRRCYSSIEEVPDDARYDAVVSIAALEHVTDLPVVVSRSGLLLSAEGTFHTAFPSEGGFLWGCAWRLTTGIEFRLRHGLDYGALMRHEHVNTAAEILAILNHFYENVEVCRFPTPSRHFSFYTAAVARQPRLDRCRALCEQRTALRTSVP